MKILVTGGAGFIGSHLAEALLEKGHTITVIDNLSTGRKENIKHLLQNKNFSFKLASVLNKELMEPLVKDADRIYHLAAALGVKNVIENPLRSAEINLKGTEMVLELASKYSTNEKKKKVLITSSSEVYGKNLELPYTEESDSVIGPTNSPRAGYALAKALDEFIAIRYHREKGLPVTIVRLFNTVGPRQVGTYGMVVPRFITSALRNEPIQIFGDGQQTRSFTHVSDAIEAIILLSNTPDAVGEIFNFGGPSPVTIEALAKKIIEKTNSRSEIKYTPLEKVYGGKLGEMQHRRPDISKLTALTGFIPKYDLNKILEDMIQHIRAENDARQIDMQRRGSASKKTKIGVIGIGYVGNAVKKGFELYGFEVRAHDKYKESDTFEATVQKSDIIFMCVPTPPLKGVRGNDLSVVEEVLDRAAALTHNKIVVIKSTVLPGTAQAFQTKYPSLRILSNPEFLDARTAESDFLNSDKILIGYPTGQEAAAEEVAKLYEALNAPVKIVPSEVAEMTKYMVNTYYATRVVFANQIYDFCEALGINYDAVRACFELDKRVAPGHFDVFHGGYRGAGGPCLPKELSALINKANQEGIHLALLNTVEQLNRVLMGDREFYSEA